MKRWHIVAAICLLVVGFIFCVVPLSSQATELTLWTRIPEILDGWDYIISEFEKLHPDVRISHRLLDWARTAEILLPAFAAGTAPDLIDICDVSIMKQLGERRMFVDLTEFYSEYRDRFPMAVDVYAAVDGRYYGTPIIVSALAHIYYNKNLVEKYGITPTDDWTYSDFLDACEKLKNQGEIPIVNGNKEGLDGEHWIQALMTETIGGSGIMALLERTDPDTGPRWTDPKVVQAVQAFEDLHKRGYFIEGMAAMGQFVAHLQFAAGKAAFHHLGTWISASLAKHPEFRWGWFRFPHMAGEIGATRNGGVVSHLDLITINSSSVHQDIGLEFIEFYTRPEVSGHAFYDLCHQHPSVAGALKGKELSEFDQASIEFYETCDDNAIWFSVYLPHEVGTEHITRASTAISSGELSAIEFCKRLEKAHQDNLRAAQE